MQPEFDAVVIGGGHNGLVAAAYLAKAGLSVLILERQPIVGGACITSEIAPGYRCSTAAYACSLLHPVVVEELQLERFGLRVYPKEPQSFVPFPDRQHLFFWRDPEKTKAEIRRFSERDAEAYPRFLKFWEGVGVLMEQLALAPPPSIAEILGSLGDEAQEYVVKLFLRSAKELLDEWFESEHVKAALCPNAIIGAAAGPLTPGSAYILAHHSVGQVGGVRGVWGYPKGGMGAITAAMAKAAESFGARIRLRSEVERVIIREGAALGVELKGGERIYAKATLSNADPKRTFLRLVGPENLDSEFRRKIEAIKYHGVSMKVNCVLEELPDFEAYPGRTVGPQHTGTIDITPSVEYLERAWDDAKYGAPSRQPFVECFIQSTVDDTLAPKGKHVISMFVQYTPYRLRGGSWDELREEYADRVVETLDAYAPNFKRSVVHRQVITPLDLERHFGLTEGDIFHGAMTPDQLLSFRPVPGWSGYRTPIRNLYLCGSGAHPGGGVFGAPGHNAAKVVIQDLAAKK